MSNCTDATAPPVIRMIEAATFDLQGVDGATGLSDCCGNGATAAPYCLRLTMLISSRRPEHASSRWSGLSRPSGRTLDSPGHSFHQPARPLWLPVRCPWHSVSTFRSHSAGRSGCTNLLHERCRFLECTDHEPRHSGENQSSAKAGSFRLIYAARHPRAVPAPAPAPERRWQTIQD